MKKDNAPSESNSFEKLSELTRHPGFVYVLARAAADNSFFKAKSEHDPQVDPNVKELVLVSGLVAQHPIELSPIPDESTVNEKLHQLYTSLQNIHHAYVERAIESFRPRIEALLADVSEGSVPPDDIASSEPTPGDALIESFFYSGVGAYDFQYLDWARQRYRFDSDWICRNVGISIDRLVRVAKRLQKLQECRYLLYLVENDHEEKCKRALETFSFCRADLGFLTDSEFDAFVERFAVTPGQLKFPIDSITSINELEFKPIVHMGPDTFFMPVSFKLAESIYESPSYWMFDDPTYEADAAANKGKTTEETAAQLLERVFPGRVYKNVYVRDGSHTVAEIDVLAWAGDRAIVVEAKSKGLTVLSRQGNDAKIAEDFDLAVQGAYEQALKSRDALFKGSYTLEDADGSPIELPDSLADVYVVCLTSSPLPVISHKLDSFLKRDPTQPYPVAMSVFDLDIVTTYLQDPYELLHYIKHRTESPEKMHGANEVAMLATYLWLGLFVPNDVSAVFLAEDMAGLIDEDFPQIRGRRSFLTNLLARLSAGTSRTAAHRERNHDDSAYNRLRARRNNKNLNGLKSLLFAGPEAMPTEAHFMLLDIPTHAVEEFLNKALQMKQQCKETGSITSCSIQTGIGEGISYVCFPDGRPVLLGEIQVTVEAWKHKAKADKWLGFFGLASSTKIADRVAFLSDPWVTDPEMDKTARSLLQGDPELKKLHRNDPCWCNSGLKFKRCHGQ